MISFYQWALNHRPDSQSFDKNKQKEEHHSTEKDIWILGNRLRAKKHEKRTKFQIRSQLSLHPEVHQLSQNPPQAEPFLQSSLFRNLAIRNKLQEKDVASIIHQRPSSRRMIKHKRYTTEASNSSANGQSNRKSLEDVREEWKRTLKVDERKRVESQRYKNQDEDRVFNSTAKSSSHRFTKTIVNFRNNSKEKSYFSQQKLANHRPSEPVIAFSLQRKGTKPKQKAKIGHFLHVQSIETSRTRFRNSFSEKKTQKKVDQQRCNRLFFWQRGKRNNESKTKKQMASNYKQTDFESISGWAS